MKLLVRMEIETEIEVDNFETGKREASKLAEGIGDTTETTIRRVAVQIPNTNVRFQYV